MTVATGKVPKMFSIVRYSDMANPGTTYIVLDIPHRDERGWWTGYKLRATEEPFTITSSDLRQAGWKIFDSETETWERVLA